MIGHAAPALAVVVVIVVVVAAAVGASVEKMILRTHRPSGGSTFRMGVVAHGS